MPDLPELLRHPLPDAAHDDLRVAVVSALEQVAEQIQRIDDAFLLLLSTADFAQSTLNTTVAGQAAIAQTQNQAQALGTSIGEALANTDDLQRQVADLTDRLAQLEALSPTDALET